MTEEQERSFTQEEVNKIVGDARVKAREVATAEAQAQRTKDEETANQANLAAKEEWETLAKTSQAKVSELEPLAKTVNTYEVFIDGVLNDRIKELGDAAKSAVAALPEGITSMDKLSWLTANVALFQEEAGAGPGVGTPSRPKAKPKGKTDPATISKFPLKL